MGLAASQARILLLTAKNDSLELQAQLISNERLILAQEQEEIANDYSDATSNQIYTCRVLTNHGDGNGNNKEYTNKSLTLASLAQAEFKLSPVVKKTTNSKEKTETGENKDGETTSSSSSSSSSSSAATTTPTEAEVKAKKGKTKEELGEDEFNKYDLDNNGKIDDADVTKAKESATTTTTEEADYDPGIVFVKINGVYYGAQAKYDIANDRFDMTYYKDGEEISKTDPVISALNSEGAYSFMQSTARNGTLEIYTGQPSSEDNNVTTGVQIGDLEKKFVRKSLESLSSVSSRYYTEDDATAQAEYNQAMNRVNAMDKRLENKLNQVETQKKSVETELDSAKQIVKSNTERTFKYFS